MPIEIKELLIKAVVSDTTKQNNSQPSDFNMAKIKKELIKEITEKVLRILKEKNER